MAKNTGKVREFCQSGKVGTLLSGKKFGSVQNWVTYQIGLHEKKDTAHQNPKCITLGYTSNRLKYKEVTMHQIVPDISQA